jgi:hypothetical protein
LGNFFLNLFDEARPIRQSEVCKRMASSRGLIISAKRNCDGKVVRVETSMCSPGQRKKKMSRSQRDVRRRTRSIAKRKMKRKIRV